MTVSVLEALQTRLQHRFADLSLLQLALTHRSFSAQHNERLEYLGDAVLDLSIAARLYHDDANAAEGDLSRTRAQLVRQESLHRVAVDLGLPGLLRLGEGELRSGGGARASILADALEATIGAVFLDAGYPAADQLVQRLFAAALSDPATRRLAKDAKTALQEWLQARQRPRPNYRVVSVTGAEHAQCFLVACELPDQAGLMSTGQGASRRLAEQAAAAGVLAQLESSVS